MRNSSPISIILIFLISTFIFRPISGQNIKPAVPLSTGFPDLLRQAELVKLKSPDASLLLQEDKLSEGPGDPYRMGVSLPVNLDCAEAGSWQDIPGGKLWILKIQAQEAMGLGLYFNKFQLPEGCTVHVFDSAVTQVLGAFTHKSNPEGSFYASGITPGSEIIIECFRPINAAMPDIIIDEVLYVYRSAGIPQVNSTKDFGGSEPCEVNINCEEGQAWQDVKHSIVRILTKNGNVSSWCSGSLVNNTRNDYTPYILTADHCAQRYGGIYASPADLAKWLFYFNFESDNCSNPLVRPPLFSTVGAVKMAGAGLESGSDFYLIMLSHDIPGDYLPFYNGWDRSGVAAASGVCIHHPEGDIKKISIFNTTLVSSEYGTTPGTHWKVTWSPTVNGNGVTEPGSSGSPLFDETGHILGCLTGGTPGSSCTRLLDPDYFGKFDYSWESNGSADSTQLRPWLDPDNTGTLVLPGSYNNDQVVADFSADMISIPVGSSINFSDQSLRTPATRTPTSWAWSFEGAEPTTSDRENPEGVRYSTLGTYDVQLIASNFLYSDTIKRKNYIRVTPAIFPNPSQGIVYILSGKEDATGNPILVYNQLGKLVYKTRWPSDAGNVFTLDISRFSGNIFFVSFYSPKGVTTSKILILPRH